MPPIPPTTTDFGAARTSIVAALRAALTTQEAMVVKGIRTEKAADEIAKGYNSIYVVDRGSRAETPEGSGNGYLRQWERRRFDVLIYVQSGKTLEQDELTLLTLAARCKYIVTAFTPAGQANNDGCLELSVDEPITDYMDANGVSMKVRQTYSLPVLLASQIT